MQRRMYASAVGAIAATATLVACGSNGSSGGSASSGSVNKNATVVWGTTDSFKSLDPAYDYDNNGQQIIYNVYQNLLKVPPGANKPVPDAASSCDFTGDVTYTCTLKSGLKFSNGDPLDVNAVVYSFKRMVAINDPNGPAVLLGAMKNIAAQGTDKVVFTLNQHDNTWPYVLTTLAAAIVDPKVYPAKSRLADSKIIGSGPYMVQSYQPHQQLALVKNPNYAGDDQLQNAGVTIKYEQSDSTLKLDVEQGSVDIAFQSLSPTEVSALQTESSRGVKVIQGAGAAIRYIVFLTNKGPGANKAIRQAIAYLVDRDSIAHNVYNDQVVPLYSMVAQGLDGATDAFKTVYGASPDKAKAQQLLQQAGVKTPVKITAWYTPSHYGPVSADEWTEIRRQLNSSGLFDISLKSQEWEQYQNSYVAGAFQMWQLGWFPDYTDADDYLSPFYPKGGFFNNHYDNTALDQLITKEKAESDKNARLQEIQQAQMIGAQDAPTIPLWQSKQFAAVRNNVSGFDKTLDRAYTIRLWLVGKS